MERTDMVARMVAKRIVQRAKPNIGSISLHQERDRYLKTRHGKQMLIALESFIIAWSKTPLRSPYDDLYLAAKEYNQGLISEEGFKVILQSFVEDVKDKDDLTALAQQITLEE